MQASKTLLLLSKIQERRKCFNKMRKAFCIRGGTEAQMFSIFDLTVTAGEPATACSNGTHSGRVGVLVKTEHVRDIGSWVTKFRQEISCARSVCRSLKMSFVLLPLDYVHSSNTTGIAAIRRRVPERTRGYICTAVPGYEYRNVDYHRLGQVRHKQ